MADTTHSQFASASLLEHLARGALGMGAIATAIWLGSLDGVWWALPVALPLAGLALLAFRGCPMCWTIGLAEMLGRALRRDPKTRIAP